MTDLNNWELISDVVESYTTNTLPHGTYFYKVKVTAADCSDLEEDFTNTITVNVLPELIAGVLLQPETICYEVEPITIGFDTT